MKKVKMNTSKIRNKSNSSCTDLLGDMKKSDNDLLFEALLTDPEKRAKVLELLTQEGLVSENTSPNRYLSPIKRLQKNNARYNSPTNSLRLESPSALGRRRALQRLESSSSADEPKKLPSPKFTGSPVPYSRLLDGVFAYCEVQKNGEDRSSAVKSMMIAMGAVVKDKLDTDVTHVIFKDGLYSTFRKAKLLKIHVVSVLWLEAVRKNKFRVPEANYSAFGDTRELDVSKICENLNQDYEDVIEDEYRRKSELSRRRRSEALMIKEGKPSRGFSSAKKLNYKDPFNRTDIATPYKYRVMTPELSESDSYISVGSNSVNNIDVIPCSQNFSTSQSINNVKSNSYSKVNEECEESFRKTNLAKYAKDSLELQNVSQTNSAENVRKDNSNITEKSELSSLKLRLSTTDESNLNNNNSKTQHDTNSSNFAQNVIPSPGTSKNNSNSNADINKNKRRITGIKRLPNRNKTKTDLNSNETQNENEIQETDKTPKNLSDLLSNKKRPRLIKLFNPNSSKNELKINSDEEIGENSVIESPPKKGKYKVPLTELPKILSSKARQKVSTIKKNEKIVGNTNKRKSVRALKFSSSSETSDVDIPTKRNATINTPSRRSMRILAKTPTQNTKTVYELKEKSSENLKAINKSPNIKNSKTVNELNKNDSESSETDSEANKKVSNKLESQNSRKTPIRRKTIQNLRTRRTQHPDTPNLRKNILEQKLQTNGDSNRRSSFDFVPQKSNKSLENLKSTQKPKVPKVNSIVCTRFHKPDVQVFQQIVKKLGGFVVEDEVSKRTTHLVAGDLGRTVNMLRAIARGCWILRKEWIYKSLEAGKWLEEEDFEMVEFSPAVQKCRLEKQSFGSLYSMDIFKDCGTIFVSRAASPRFSDLEELLELCGGRVVRVARNAKVVVGEKTQHEGVASVNVNWILDSITINKKQKFRGYLL